MDDYFSQEKKLIGKRLLLYTKSMEQQSGNSIVIQY